MTGVQTCALPICADFVVAAGNAIHRPADGGFGLQLHALGHAQVVPAGGDGRKLGNIGFVQAEAAARGDPAEGGQAQGSAKAPPFR